MDHADITPSHPNGVSVVICCFNSSSRLPETLAHLAAQRVPDPMSWELILVDNGSTDGTSDVASRLWPSTSSAPIRVVREDARGLSNARRRGMREARFDLVSFVDDDNWVCPEWIALLHEVFTAHPEVGACGGGVTGVFEAPPPSWFADYRHNFALGPQHPEPGDVTHKRYALWGAGLTLRKAAWERLVNSGYHPMLSDRSGAALTSGGDHELVFSLVLAGWRLWYEPKLHMQHFMPRQRLTWDYLRRLLRGTAWSSAWLDPYAELLGQAPGQHWLREGLWLAFLLLRNPVRLARCSLGGKEGDRAATTHELLWGRMSALLRHGPAIKKFRKQLRAQHPSAGNSPSSRLTEWDVT